MSACQQKTRKGSNTMKKKSLGIILIVAGLLVLCSFSLLMKTVNERQEEMFETRGDYQVDTPIDHRLNEEGMIKREYAKKIIAELAEEVIQAISNKDTEKIAVY